MIARTVMIGGPDDARIHVPYRAERDAGGTVRVYRKDVLVMTTTWLEEPRMFNPCQRTEEPNTRYTALTVDLKIDIHMMLEDAFRRADGVG